MKEKHYCGVKKAIDLWVNREGENISFNRRVRQVLFLKHH